MSLAEMFAASPSPCSLAASGANPPAGMAPLPLRLAPFNEAPLLDAPLAVNPFRSRSAAAAETCNRPADCDCRDLGAWASARVFCGDLETL